MIQWILGRLVTLNEMQRLWAVRKIRFWWEVVVIYLTLLPWHSSSGTEDNDLNNYAMKTETRIQFELGTFKIQASVPFLALQLFYLKS
jgi:hypothetical protein